MCRIMSFLRHQFDIDWIAVQPMTRSIITMLEPSSFAKSARSYMSSIVAPVTLK